MTEQAARSRSLELVELLMKNPLLVKNNEYKEGDIVLCEGARVKHFLYQKTSEHLRLRVAYVLATEGLLEPNLTIKTVPIDMKTAFIDSTEFYGRKGIERRGLEYLQMSWEDGHSVRMKGDGTVFVATPGTGLSFKVNPSEIDKKYASLVAQTIEVVQGKMLDQIIIQ